MRTGTTAARTVGRARTDVSGLRGFTLIELLVVMSLIVLLASIAVLVVPSVMDQQRGSTGASRVQGWLIAAQQRAVLDRAPRGVRLLPDAVNPQLVTQLQYIERPDDFVGGTITTSTAGGVTTVTFSADLSGGQGANQALWPVQVGDYLEVQGTGLMHQITAVTANSVTLASPLPYDILTATAQYRIERAVRVLGEDPLEMPANVAIDLTTNTNPGNKYGTSLQPGPQPPGPVDILFSPKGELLGNAGATPLVLWVHDTTLSDEFQGSPSLIVIYPRSGKIAAVEVNPNSTYTTGNNLNYPYAFVQ
jgi:prepilin-type N-terminal cleavage/methylation domain-containing protein